ncbi:hypothetical protein [uncultured Gimesia sp.]|uniref:hypothetical protein n=1 Tax=uncultured Gimesia sp. TaxID=1678688 RepID=UPI002625884A|nr:hypothetical protein [uncultured Gimesia sp.]
MHLTKAYPDSKLVIEKHSDWQSTANTISRTALAAVCFSFLKTGANALRLMTNVRRPGATVGLPDSELGDLV